MAIKRPDIYEHNNPNNSFTDSDFVRGGFRSAVADLSTLYGLSSKVDQLKENSTIVYVSSELNYYELVDIANVNNSNGWRVLLSNNFPVSGATNGLTLSNKNVILGGALTGATTLSLANNPFVIKSTSSSNCGVINYCLTNTYSNSNILINMCDSSGARWGLCGSNSKLGMCHYSNDSNGNCIDICNSNIVFHNRTIGCDRIVYLNANAMNYACDYSNAYTSRSLVDKEYVDNEICNNSNIINVCNIGTTYTTTEYDFYVGVSGVCCMYLFAAPKAGQRLIVTDICGDAELKPIRIDGNGNTINGCATALINTNYGSLSFVYNCIEWSVVGFVN